MVAGACPSLSGDGGRRVWDDDRARVWAAMSVHVSAKAGKSAQ